MYVHFWLIKVFCITILFGFQSATVLFTFYWVVFIKVSYLSLIRSSDTYIHTSDLLVDSARVRQTCGTSNRTLARGFFRLLFDLWNSAGQSSPDIDAGASFVFGFESREGQRIFTFRSILHLSNQPNLGAACHPIETVPDLGQRSPSSYRVTQKLIGTQDKKHTWGLLVSTVGKI